MPRPRSSRRQRRDWAHRHFAVVPAAQLLTLRSLLPPAADLQAALVELDHELLRRMRLDDGALAAGGLLSRASPDGLAGSGAFNPTVLRAYSPTTPPRQPSDTRICVYPVVPLLAT